MLGVTYGIMSFKGVDVAYGVTFLTKVLETKVLENAQVETLTATVCWILSSVGM